MWRAWKNRPSASEDDNRRPSKRAVDMETARRDAEETLMARLERAGVRAARSSSKEDGEPVFSNAASAVNAACQAAAFAIEELASAQRRLSVAAAANARLAQQVSALEERALRMANMSLSAESAEEAYRNELERLRARTERLSAALDSVLSIAEGYKHAESSRDSELQVEREFANQAIASLRQELEDLGRSRAELLARVSSLECERDAALSEVTRLSPAPSHGGGAPPRAARGAAAAATVPASAPAAVFSLAGGEGAAVPPAADAKSEQRRRRLETEISRLQRELSVEHQRRAEAEAAAKACKATLSAAEKLTAQLREELQSVRRRATEDFDAKATELRRAVEDEAVDDALGLSATGPVRVAPAASEAKVVAIADMKTEDTVLRSPVRSGKKGAAEAPFADDAPRDAFTVDRGIEGLWSPSETVFSVRGPTYMSDRVKQPSAPSTATLLHFDLFKSEGRVDHVLGRLAPLRERLLNSSDVASSAFIIAVNIQIPGTPFISAVAYYGIRREDLPDGLGVDTDAAVLQDMGLSDGMSSAAGGRAEPLTAGQKELLRSFIDGSDDYRDARLKLIPAVIDAPWVVRRAVGNRPAIVGKKLKSRYFRGQGYLEVDIDISSSSVATSILALVRDASRALTVEVAFTIEGQDAAELPERLLGGTRFTRMDFQLATREIPASQDAGEAS